MKISGKRLLSVCHFVVFLLCGGQGYALGPHQLVLLVNQNSKDSMMIANHYIQMRGIPLNHVIYLNIPAAAANAPYAITSDEFERFILNPVDNAIKQRGLSPIYAWIYSAGFPTKVTTGTTDDLSIHGMTFLRGRVPDANTVKQGKYASSLFAGPEPPKGSIEAARTFDVSMTGALVNQPLPCMSLGFLGPGGSTKESVLRCLTRGVLADGTTPKGTVYLVKNSDVRSTARDWQFLPIQQILTGMNVHCVVVTNEISGKTDILGLQNGRTHIDPLGYGRYLPGAMAEHLTSCGAIFDDSGQSHCTAWIDAGATASSGAVTEPYAIWTKFPASTFYVYYAQGCTVIESFFQSVKAPLQLFMVGDPLSCPWRKMFAVTLVTLKDDPQSGMADFFAQLMPAAPPGSGIRFKVYLDGVPVFHPPVKSMISLDTRKLSDGFHRLRMVAEFGINVTWSAFDEKGFEVDNHGKRVVMGGVSGKEKIPMSEKRSIPVSFTGKPVRAGLACGVKELYSMDISEEASAILSFDPAIMGSGPVELSAFVEYDGGERVYSKPVFAEIVE